MKMTTKHFLRDLKKIRGTRKRRIEQTKFLYKKDK